MTKTVNTEKVLQVLHLHKLELEIQNHELCRAYAALDTFRNHYVQLYDFAPASLLTLTCNGLILNANHSCGKLIGVVRETLLDTPFAKYLIPEETNRWHLFFKNAQIQSVRQHCELSLLRTDGKIVIVLLDCQNAVSADGPVTLLSLTDITKRVSQEETRRIAASAFETEDGMIVTDADKTILRINKAFSRITGYNASDAIGKKPAFLYSGIQDAQFYQHIWSTVAVTGYWQGEIWDKRKSGEIFPLSLTITAVIDKETQITHYVGSFRDISLEKQIENVLNETHIRLENQMSETQSELNKSVWEIKDIKTALKVLLKQQKSDKEEAKTALLQEAEATIFPFLKKLKAASTGRRQATRLIDVIESNLMTLVASYGHAETLSSAFRQMTPTQAQVASLIRQGLPTKLIASTMNIAPGTISVHRKQIRKKLGLDNKADNLQIYLKSLPE
jgi:PAS domain S-box-containing protein